ncbi:DnaD domain-containing protein [Desulforamulus ruminis]|uniref:Primosome, DnaD subunit n=1 Tax=Desulforamulus ruminis (strain ATCC 23193 / DSM 2154 / NCIMB 8452 / DL) TaxID=696281 RepID=F6DSU7_DESRL|nr:DnaD domain protein [Desulforamulus ruminis]AEG59941.1 primosome, DnaD subunit [Desulforamulus ruminis DSM 2154]
MSPNRRPLKKEFDATNMTVYFGSALFTSGITGIPNLFLKYYREVGITDAEMMLIIQLLRFRNEEQQLMPGTEALAGCLAADPLLIERQIKSLLDKKIIGITNYYNHSDGSIVQGYDFEPLVFELSEVWALNQKRELDHIAQKMNHKGKGPEKIEDEPDLSFSAQQKILCQTFEKEFGRLLSPMEVEQIAAWIEEMEVDLILEALRQAVMRGKHNFKYIGSILLGWKKNNLRTLQEVMEYQRIFSENRAKQGQRKTETESGSRMDQKKKALMRSMYS